jgi:hypothetical protein
VRRWLCKLSFLPLWWFHKPEVIEEYDSQTRKLRCRHCGDYFAMSDRHQAILPWDEDYERITCDIYDLPRTKI